MNYDKEKLVNQLIRHEGMELKVYKDSLGIETIGVGRNLVDRGVSEEEARYLCNNDIDIVEQELGKVFLSLIALTILALGFFWIWLSMSVFLVLEVLKECGQLWKEEITQKLQKKC